MHDALQALLNFSFNVLDLHRLEADVDPRNAEDFAKRYAPGLAVFHDGPDGLARSLDLPALPYTLVLDREGRIVWSGGGADASALAQIGTAARRAAESRGLADGATEGTTR